MKLTIALWAMLAILPSARPSAPHHCQLLPEKGCLITPLPNPQGLILYLRGHYSSYRGQVPVEARAASLQEALKTYQLADIAKNLGMAIFVSTSSHLSYTSQELDVLFSTISPSHNGQALPLFIAAHSGGYVGMFETLRTLPVVGDGRRLVRLIMLDNYYSTQQDNLTILKNLLVNHREIECLGFATSHNRGRFERLYAPLGCRAQSGPEFDHVLSVKQCLSAYVLGQDCHP